ncbi:hypothetical protein LJK88_44420 [Paenibacillus sp. P26]|nr:hypothetical protein LJK88_44420 [Paenibacillus sp. P26]
MFARHQTFSEKAFDIFNYVFLAVVALSMILPIMYIVAGSFASDAEIGRRAFFLIPQDASLNAYKFVFKDNTRLEAY